jgi:hypothetical protein
MHAAGASRVTRPCPCPCPRVRRAAGCCVMCGGQVSVERTRCLRCSRDAFAPLATRCAAALAEREALYQARTATARGNQGKWGLLRRCGL